MGKALAAPLHDDRVPAGQCSSIALALGFGFLNEVAAIAAFEPVQDLASGSY